MIKDLSSEEMFEIYSSGQKIGKVLGNYYSTGDFHYTIQDGENAGQSVKQVHLHVIPWRKLRDAGGVDNEMGQARSIKEMENEADIYRELLDRQERRLE